MKPILSCLCWCWFSVHTCFSTAYTCTATFVPLLMCSCQAVLCFSLLILETVWCVPNQAFCHFRMCAAVQQCIDDIRRIVLKLLQVSYIVWSTNMHRFAGASGFLNHWESQSESDTVRTQAWVFLGCTMQWYASRGLLHCTDCQCLWAKLRLHPFMNRLK